MKARYKAIELVDTYRMMLMNEDTECGQKILCTIISKKSALIAVDEIMKAMDDVMLPNPFRQYWDEVKEEIEKL